MWGEAVDANIRSEPHNEKETKDARARSHLVNYGGRRQLVRVLKGGITHDTHRDSWVLAARLSHPNR